MVPKRVLVPDRLRRPPATGWSWVDRRFLREHMAYLSPEATLLYFILCTVADKHGMSFYGDGTLAAGSPRSSHCSRCSSGVTRSQARD